MMHLISPLKKSVFFAFFAVFFCPLMLIGQTNDIRIKIKETNKIKL